MPCCGPNMSPRRSSIVHIVFSCWSFEISKNTVRNHKFLNLFSVWIHFLTVIEYIWPSLDTSLCIDHPEERCKSISLWLHVVKSLGSLTRRKKPKPLYGHLTFSLICSLILKNISLFFLFIFHYFYH